MRSWIVRWPAHNAYVYIRRNSCSILAMCLKPRNQSAAISLNHTFSSEQWAHVTFVDFGLWLETWRETRGVRIEWAAGFKTELFQFAHHSAVNSDLHVTWKGVKWSHAHASMHVHNSQNIFQNTFSSFNSQLPGARCKFLFVMIKAANKTQETPK